jgi:SAM-dependent methyltransferase
VREDIEMPIDYRASHVAAGKGKNYKASFSRGSHRGLIWDLEKQVLNDVINEFMPHRPIAHLDFACGTGRIATHLEDKTAMSVGVDVSPEMLRIAREDLRHSRIVEADLTRNDVLTEEKFDLITAFRFFPGAQADLREQVMAILAKHLKVGGYLIFNNHRNMSSLLYRGMRLLGRPGGREGMNYGEVVSLVSGAGLRIRKLYGLGLIPWANDHLILPKLFYAVESVVSQRGILRNLCVNNVFVCSRQPPVRSEEHPAMLMHCEEGKGRDLRGDETGVPNEANRTRGYGSKGKTPLLRVTV